MKNYSLSCQGIESYIWDVRICLEKKHGSKEAERFIAPLNYYIYTGRAGAYQIRKILGLKPFVMARILANITASDEVIIANIKKKAGIE